jgi:hypothetical protein
VLRLGVNPRERKIAEDESQLRAQPFPNLFYDGVGFSAVGTLIITILDQGDRRSFRTGQVIARSNRQDKL